MKCRKCGADLLDTDTYCVKCGQRVDQPMSCPSCGEKLRDGERFCHKCGSPIEPDVENEEIPISRLNTIDIPFEQIEQGLLMEAKQAIVKRPETEKAEERKPEDYAKPRAEEHAGHRQAQTGEQDSGRQAHADGEERYRQELRRQAECAAEEDDDYDEDDEADGGSKMKVLTIILGIAVVAVALAIGYVLWQRSHTPNGERPGAGTEQGEQAGETESGENGNSADTQGRIQVLKNVNVRNKPTTEGSEVIMVAKTGEIYDYYELTDDAWYHIKLDDGSDGYVSAKYVEDLE